MRNEKVNFYIPIRNQISKAISVLIFFNIFAIIQLVRAKETGAYGIFEYWSSSLKTIPNDYKFLLYGSIMSILLLITQFFSTTSKNPEEKNYTQIFFNSFLRIFPVMSNLFIIIFFFYIIFYRGFWALSELKVGFNIYPILRFLFFVLFGHYGYIAYTNLATLKRLLRLGKEEEAIIFVKKKKLLNI
ncbi:MAG TPA: hypothetical protein PLV83_05730 [Bacilli bacterium]|nr:hypothetical protein [Bacilli bacterium]